MKEEQLFATPLGLPHPWEIEKVDLSYNQGAGNIELHIWIGYEEKSKFQYKGQSCPVYDHQDRFWRHLNFYQHLCLHHCRTSQIISTNAEACFKICYEQIKGYAFLMYLYPSCDDSTSSCPPVLDQAAF